MVSPNHKNAGFLSPELKINGNMKLQRELTKGFHVELVSILKKVRLAGVFVVTLKTTVRGSPHAKGRAYAAFFFFS